MEDTIEDEQMLNSFANFRRQTLIRYLEASQNHSPELKAKLLDWKPEVLESKTRHQTTKAREVTAYKEIFGLELSGIVKKSSSSNRKKSKAAEEKASPAKTEPSVSKTKVETTASKATEKTTTKKSSKKGKKN